MLIKPKQRLADDTAYFKRTGKLHLIEEKRGFTRLLCLTVLLLEKAISSFAQENYSNACLCAEQVVLYYFEDTHAENNETEAGYKNTIYDLQHAQEYCKLAENLAMLFVGAYKERRLQKVEELSTKINKMHAKADVDRARGKKTEEDLEQIKKLKAQQTANYKSPYQTSLYPTTSHTYMLTPTIIPGTNYYTSSYR